MPRSKPEPPPKPRCTATLWNTGKTCDSLTADGQTYCAAHLALLTPEAWLAAGYAPAFSDPDQALFRSARFSDLSEEVALARMHLRSVAADPGHTRSDLLSALFAVAKLIKLRQDIDDARRQTLSQMWP